MAKKKSPEIFQTVDILDKISMDREGIRRDDDSREARIRKPLGTSTSERPYGGQLLSAYPAGTLHQVVRCA